MVEAAAAWATDQDVSLGFKLVEKGVLQEKDRVLLNSLVDEAIQAHGGDAAETIKSFGGEEQLRKSLCGSTELDNMQTVPMAGSAFFARSGTIVSGVEEAPGRYTVVSHHAKGGMGRVLLVHDDYLGRNIALKELLLDDTLEGTSEHDTSMRRTSSMVARFLQEARITGQLEHPAIVPVYELGRRHDGTIYYTMKLVKGKNLGQVLRDCRDLKQRMDLLPNFVDLCQAIAYAHSRGVIHRDVKPGNVMVGEFGETVVLDWGLAKVHDVEDVNAEDIEDTLQFLKLDNEEALFKTAYGRALGTPHYMPPEQAEGRTDAIDERSDVYSLGAVLYEILTGATPYSGKNTREVLDKVIHTDPEPVLKADVDIPPELAGICTRAIQRDPRQRYQSAMELAEDVRRFITGSLVQAYRYSLREMMAYYYKRHRPIVHSGLTFAAVLACIGVYSYVSILHARDREREQRKVAESQAYVSQIRLVQASLKDNNFPFAPEALWTTSEGLRNWEWGYLLNECSQDRATVTLDASAMSRCAFTSDGRYVISTAAGRPPQIWDGLTLQALGVADTGGETIQGFCAAPRGSTFVTYPRDRTARIIDAGTRSELRVLRGHEGNITKACYSANGKLLLTTAEDKTVRLWNTESGAEIATLCHAEQDITSADFSPDGSQILTESVDGQVSVWDAASRKESFRISGRLARFSPDGRYILTIEDPRASLWDARTGERARLLEGHTDKLIAARISSNSELVVTSSYDNTVRTWSIATGQAVRVFSFATTPIQIVLSPDGKTLFVAFPELPAALKVLESGADLGVVAGHSQPIVSADFSGDGQRIVTSSLDGRLKLWDVSLSTRRALTIRLGSYVYDAAFSPDGKLLAAIADSGQLRFSSPDSGREKGALEGYGVGARRFAFNGDGTMLVTTLDAFTPMTWNVATQTPVAAFTHHVGRVEAVAFSPDGSRVASGSWDNTIRIWDAHSGEELEVLTGHSDTVCDVAFSRDGTRILSASWDRTARIWDLASGAEVKRFEGHADKVFSARFSLDDRQVVTASADGTARIWDVASGNVTYQLVGHHGEVNDAVFAPDQCRVFTASSDRTAKVWDATSGAELLTLKGHGAGVVRLEADLSGKKIISSSYDGTARVWNAAPWQLRELPGDGSRPWRERYALYREVQCGKLQSDIAQSNSLEYAVVTTREVFNDAWDRFELTLTPRSEATTGCTSGAQPGVAVEDGPRRDALARLCFKPGDRIVRICNFEVDSANSVAEALIRLRNQSKSPQEVPPTLDIIRDETPIHITFRFYPNVCSKKVIALPRDRAIQLLRTEQNMFAANKATILRYAQGACKNMGEPFELPDGINGTWVLQPKSGSEKAFYLALGLAPGDRVVRYNQVPVTSLRQLSDTYEALCGSLESGQDVTLALDVERGEFQRLEITIRSE